MIGSVTNSFAFLLEPEDIVRLSSSDTHVVSLLVFSVKGLVQPLVDSCEYIAVKLLYAYY